MTETIEVQNGMVSPLTATILITGTTSDAIPLYGTTAKVFQMPGAFTGTAITFLGSIDNGATFKAIKDSADAAISFTVSVDSSYTLDADIFAGYDKIKFVSNAGGGGEVAEREILVKPFII